MHTQSQNIFSFTLTNLQLYALLSVPFFAGLNQSGHSKFMENLAAYSGKKSFSLIMMVSR